MIKLENKAKLDSKAKTLGAVRERDDPNDYINEPPPIPGYGYDYPK